MKDGPTADTGTKVGIITKEFSGMMQEWFTDADNFGVQFYDRTQYGPIPAYHSPALTSPPPLHAQQ